MIIKLSRIILSIISYHYCKIFKFIFNKKHYNYFYNKYNKTWQNERAVEIPIIKDILKQNKGKKILEVGNVLTHYIKCNHDVVDKYEKSVGVINQDIVDFTPKKKYDLIISISTLEHVGWDEKIKDPKKIIKAIKNMKKCLNSKGIMIITLPSGYNPYLDNLIDNKKLVFKKLYCFKRNLLINKWKQTTWKNIRKLKYNFRYFNSNGIIIGVM